MAQILSGAYAGLVGVGIWINRMCQIRINFLEWGCEQLDLAVQILEFVHEPTKPEGPKQQPFLGSVEPSERFDNIKEGEREGKKQGHLGVLELEKLISILMKKQHNSWISVIVKRICQF